MNSLTFKIINYGSEDYNDAVNLREEILRKPFGLIFTCEELANEKDQIHIAGFVKDEIVVTAVLVPEGINLKMQRVAVRQDLQNKGIATAMMRFCEDYALKHNFKEIYCHARDSAVQFYIKNDYVSEGNYFDEDTIPHLKMRKTIKHSTKD